MTAAGDGPWLDDAAGRLVRLATSDDTTEYELMAESVDALRMQRAAPPLVVPVA